MRIAVMLALLGSIVAAHAAVNNPTFWIQKSPGTNPSERFEHAIAYDAAHSQVVLFRGFAGNIWLSDTWDRDGINWTQKSPQNSPPARSQLAATYSIVVSNVGSGASQGTVTVTDAIPAGLTLVSMAGTGWTCNANVCKRTDPVASGGAYPAINGPVQVVLTNLTSGVTMMNSTGAPNGNLYITLSAGTLAPGASVTVPIQFTNPSNGLINFTPVTDSGVF